jgi:hypothetical protein
MAKALQETETMTMQMERLEGLAKMQIDVSKEPDWEAEHAEEN